MNKNGLETTHSYNARNQLIKTQEGGAVKEYCYDGRGNLTDITENGQLKANYTFDATNMMVGAFTAGKGKAEYAYNGFKNRVKKLESLQSIDTTTPDPCKEIRYILDMTLPYDNLLMTQGAQNQSFVWGNSLLSANGEEKFHYLQDHLGSPIRLLGGEQTDTALAYDEFGVPVVGAGENAHNPFGFTGYQMDDVSGLYYAQARYYAPMLGRFGAEDTHWNPSNMIYGDIIFGFDDYTIVPNLSAVQQSKNLYIYCKNNPVMYVDYTGYWAGIDDAIAAGVGALVGAGGQFVSDLVTSAVNGSWSFSSWESYVGATVGGAAGGVAFLYTGPVGAGAVTGGVTTLTTRSLRVASGKDSWDTQSILTDTLIDAGAGAVLGKFAPVKVNKITAGRNSYSAVYQSGLTKLGHGTAKRMSSKVIYKGTIVGLTSGIPLDIYYGLKAVDGTQRYCPS